MGFGVIKDNLGEGHYRVGLYIDVWYAKLYYEACQPYLDGLKNCIEHARSNIAAYRERYEAAAEELTAYLEPLRRASETAYRQMQAAYDQWIEAVAQQPDPGQIRDSEAAMNEAGKAFYTTHAALMTATQNDSEQPADWEAAQVQRNEKLAEYGAWQLAWFSASGEVFSPARVALAADQMNAASVDFDDATQGYLDAWQAGSPQLPAWLGLVKETEAAFKTATADWVKAVKANTAEGYVAQTQARYDRAKGGFEAAQKKLSYGIGKGEGPYKCQVLGKKLDENEVGMRVSEWELRALEIAYAKYDKVMQNLASHLLPFLGSGGLLKLQDVNAWCCDAVTDLPMGQAVATIEIPGERDHGVLIRPAFKNDHGWTEKDGLLQPAWAISPQSNYFNWALHPGVEKWKPRYRLGKIIDLKPEQDQCTVELESQTIGRPSRAQDGPLLDVNNPIQLITDEEGNEQKVLPGPRITSEQGVTTLKEVPIEYMDCNAQVFSAGDRIVVEFKDRDWNQPVVIGFPEDPKPCRPSGIVLWGKPNGAGAEHALLFGKRPSPTEPPIYKIRDRNPMVGGNIDWQSADQTDLITWQGPPGRSVAPAIFCSRSDYSAFKCGVFDPTHTISVRVENPNTGDSNVVNLFRRFGREIYQGGKVRATVPTGLIVLGAGIGVFTDPDTHQATKWLVVAVTPKITGSLAPGGPNKLFIRLLAVAIDGKVDPTQTVWLSAGETHYDTLDGALPAINIVAFSGNATRCATTIPRYGFGGPDHWNPTLQYEPKPLNDLIIRGEITYQKTQVMAQFTLEEQGGCSHTMTAERSEDKKLGIATATGSSTAISAIDYVGNEEVTLTSTASNFAYGEKDYSLPGYQWERRRTSSSFTLTSSQGVIASYQMDWSSYSGGRYLARYNTVEDETIIATAQGGFPIFVDLRKSRYLVIKQDCEHHVLVAGDRKEIGERVMAGLYDQEDRVLVYDVAEGQGSGTVPPRYEWIREGMPTMLYDNLNYADEVSGSSASDLGRQRVFRHQPWGFEQEKTVRVPTVKAFVDNFDAAYTYLQLYFQPCLSYVAYDFPRLKGYDENEQPRDLSEGFTVIDEWYKGWAAGGVVENQWWDFIASFDELKANEFDGGNIDTLWVDHLKQSHGKWNDQVVPPAWEGSSSAEQDQVEPEFRI